MYITPSSEENCGDYGEYEYQKETNSYRSLHFKENKEFKLINGCTYTIVNITKKNNKLIETINNNSNIKEVMEKFIKKSVEIEKEMDDKNKEKIKEKNLKLNENEYISIINLNTQTYYIYQFKNDDYIFIGKTLISSGNPKRGKKYFDTPEVVIDRTQFVNGDWLAMGTDGKGYGEKGDKIFWFGIHNGVHLAMHTTTPWGVENLGKKYSKGCIRISPIFNKILKETKIIDGIKGKFIIIESF